MTSRAYVVSSVAAILALSFAASARADDVPPPAPPSVPPAAKPAETGVAFEPGDPAFADVLAKAKEQGKSVFVDFMTDWCVWCKRLDKDTYPQAAVGDAMKAFVNVRVDAEKGEGVQLAARYNVHGFPTLVIVDASGDEIDRISGYMPPEPFVKEIERIKKGDGTLAALKKAHEATPDDVDSGIAYAAKLSAGNPEGASALFASLAEKTKDRPTQAKLKLEQASLALASARTKEAVEEVAGTAESIVKDFGDTPAAGHVASRLGRAMMFAGEKRALAFLDAARPLAADAKERVFVESLTVAVHKSAIAAALKRQGEAAGDARRRSTKRRGARSR